MAYSQSVRIFWLLCPQNESKSWPHRAGPRLNIIISHLSSHNSLHLVVPVTVLLPRVCSWCNRHREGCQRHVMSSHSHAQSSQGLHLLIPQVTRKLLPISWNLKILLPYHLSDSTLLSPCQKQAPVSSPCYSLYTKYIRLPSLDHVRHVPAWAFLLAVP